MFGGLWPVVHKTSHTQHSVKKRNGITELGLIFLPNKLGLRHVLDSGRHRSRGAPRGLYLQSEYRSNRGLPPCTRSERLCNATSPRSTHGADRLETKRRPLPQAERATMHQTCALICGPAISAPSSDSFVGPDSASCRRLISQRRRPQRRGWPEPGSHLPRAPAQQSCSRLMARVRGSMRVVKGLRGGAEGWWQVGAPIS